jgi:hypothetical protein
MLSQSAFKCSQDLREMVDEDYEKRQPGQQSG